MKETIIQFLKFGIVGFSNTAISYAIYSILVYFGLHYLVASVIAFIISVLNSFFWNNKYVFKKQQNQERNIFHALFKTFLSYAFTGLVMANILLFVFIDIMHISKYIAPLFGLAITVPTNFLLNKLWAFRTKNVIKDDVNEKNQCANSLL
jgi:putative flippase GtrA